MKLIQSALSTNHHLPTLSIPSHTKSHFLSSLHLCNSLNIKHTPKTLAQIGKGSITMATASATLSPAMFNASTIANSRRRKNVNVHYISGLNSFGGLKAHNSVASLGLPVCTEHYFAKVVSSLKAPSKGNGRGGGALSSTCNAVGEIFRIAAIMNGLVLVGVAVGFVLLRIEASVEEAE